MTIHCMSMIMNGNILYRTEEANNLVFNEQFAMQFQQ